MFSEVLNASKFNSFIEQNQFDKALNFIQKNDVKLSYIDNQSISCFDSLNKSTFHHFRVHGKKLSDEQVNILDKIFSRLLEKEPHFWFKKSHNSQSEIYYFFNFFIQSNNLDKVKFFNDNIKKFTHQEIEEKYICYREVSPEMGELIRNGTSLSKISMEEISLAKEGFYFNNNQNAKEEFLNYLDDLIANKKERKITYKHEDVVSFFIDNYNLDGFFEFIPKIIELFSPEILKPLKINKDNLENNFPYLTSRLDFIAARFFSVMNFTRNVNGMKVEPIPKSFTLPFLELLQTINPKKNINDYLIGEFRFKFAPVALELIIPDENTEWQTKLGVSKEDGFDISSKHFSTFLVHLLVDSLLKKSSFTTYEDKVQRLLIYQSEYPEQFVQDWKDFETGLKKLNIVHAINPDINNIRLYFNMNLNYKNSPVIKRSKI